MSRSKFTLKERMALAKRFQLLKKRGAKGEFLKELGIPAPTMYSWIKKYLSASAAKG